MRAVYAATPESGEYGHDEKSRRTDRLQFSDRRRIRANRDATGRAETRREAPCRKERGRAQDPVSRLAVSRRRRDPARRQAPAAEGTEGTAEARRRRAADDSGQRAEIHAGAHQRSVQCAGLVSGRSRAHAGHRRQGTQTQDHRLRVLPHPDRPGPARELRAGRPAGSLYKGGAAGLPQRQTHGRGTRDLRAEPRHAGRGRGDDRRGNRRERQVLRAAETGAPALRGRGHQHSARRARLLGLQGSRRLGGPGRAHGRGRARHHAPRATRSENAVHGVRAAGFAGARQTCSPPPATRARRRSVPPAT